MSERRAAAAAPAADPWERPLGAVRRGTGFTFRAWAPHARALALRIRGTTRPMAALGEGVWGTELDAAAGDDYVFLLDGDRALADPCSRSQPHGVRGPSRVVDVPRLPPGPSIAAEDLVVHEMHVGTFSEEGTFDGAIPHLPALRALGVNAIELMPVATFPGERGWGYDGLFAHAPHVAYGGPDGLSRLVQAAHDAGLAVLLDVVYNHVGPGSEGFAALGPYFTERHGTPWGPALDFAERGVREWAIQNAMGWIRDHGIDGLRLDAVQALFDDGAPHVMRELRDRVKSERRDALVIAETAVGDLRPVAEWAHDAQWADGLHHALHAILTGEREGYYAAYGRVADVAAAMLEAPSGRLVACAQNPDQVGNRAVGDRLAPDLLEVASTIVLFTPRPVLLFMGEEYGETRPFQFFCDHVDPAIAHATRIGRREEFAAFSSFTHRDVPDPQALATFLRSKLSRLERPGVRERYRRLLAMRRTLPKKLEILEVDERRKRLRARRGPAELVACFDPPSVRILT
jgi:maltooligosyltrehalose trehalohydrolase